MGKTAIERKLEIMQDIANLVRVHKDINLGADIATLVETQNYRHCEEFCSKMNMELGVIETKVPDEAKPIYKIRFKVAMLKGIEVFGEPSGFLQWIDKQNEAFGNESWRGLIASSAGLQKVLDVLNRRPAQKP
jgi:hypothetical protein